MKIKKTALILIGYQNDYFAENGILKEVVEESSKVTGVLNNTVNVIKGVNDLLIISTPIIFTDDYSELDDPVGILKTIKEVGAFKGGAAGSETIPEITQFGDRIIEVPGKQGLNAFINTKLDNILKENEITHVVMLGVVCSVCIDSTGRSAFEKGYKVTMLNDCISGRTVFEQKFYCENIFPLYANVIDSKSFLNKLNSATVEA